MRRGTKGGRLRRRVAVLAVGVLVASAALSGEVTSNASSTSTGGLARNVLAQAPKAHASLPFAQRVRVRGLRVPPSVRGTVGPEQELEPSAPLIRRRVGTPEVAGVTRGTAAESGVTDVTTGLSENEGRSIPPDVQLAVSSHAVVEAVNVVMTVWNRNGNQLVSPRSESLGSFFSTTSTDRRNDHLSDPRIYFDPLSDRWFATGFDVTRNETLLAMSSTNDPSGGWLTWAFASTGCPDQPRLGVTRTLVIVTDDLFSGCPGSFVGGEVRVMSKQAMLAGNVGASDYGRFGPDARYTSFTPAQAVTSVDTAFLVSLPSRSSSTVSFGSIASPTASSVAVTPIAIRAVADPPAATQQGTTTPIDTGDDRVQNAIYDNGTIWFASTDSCQVSGQSGSWGCGRLEAISADGRVVEQKELALAGGRHVLYPALASTRGGDVIAVFGVSSPSDYAGLAAVTKLRNGGDFSQYTVFAPGASSYVRPDGRGRNRWGDYFAAVRDPAAPDVVWVAGEYVQAQNLWGTKIAAVTAAPATPPAVQAPSISYSVPSSTAITNSSAVVLANLNPNGSSTQYAFDYGTTTAYGSTTPAATLGASGTFATASAQLTGLAPLTVYHFRLRAVNAGGTAYGIDQTFRTADAPAAGDTVAPRISARPSRGTAGHRVQLNLWLADNTGQARIVDQVLLRGRVVGTVRSGLITATGNTHVFWRAPRTLTGRMQHCIRAWDAAGNASGLSCAALDLR